MLFSFSLLANALFFQSQELKETILAYFFLLEHGPLTQEELDEECELFVLNEFHESIDFEVRLRESILWNHSS